MKKIGLISLIALTFFITGCGCQKEENKITNNEVNKENQSVVKDQVFEGLEFVNVGASNGVVKTIVINNTGVLYEGSKFSMKIMDSNGNVLGELTDEVKVKMETGTTHTIETKTKIDLTKAASIEYSIIQ